MTRKECGPVYEDGIKMDDYCACGCGAYDNERCGMKDCPHGQFCHIIYSSSLEDADAEIVSQIKDGTGELLPQYFVRVHTIDSEGVRQEEIGFATLIEGDHLIEDDFVLTVANSLDTTPLSFDKQYDVKIKSIDYGVLKKGSGHRFVEAVGVVGMGSHYAYAIYENGELIGYSDSDITKRDGIFRMTKIEADQYGNKLPKEKMIDLVVEKIDISAWD